MLADTVSATTNSSPSPARVRDVLALSKPRLSLLVFCTSGVGMWLAPGGHGALRSLLILLATATVVGAANALNCYLERDSDALMHRTRSRPLPARRLEPWVALVLGLIAAIVSVSVLYWVANPLTALLAAVACVVYVCVYTPLKRLSWTAVLVGAVPGAIPPLLGWTAVTGRLDAAGCTLFALLFMWQLPHFLAISLYLREDYARGGLCVLPVVHGSRAARSLTVVSAAALVPVSLLPVYFGVAGWIYGWVALIVGGAFAIRAAMGLRRADVGRWARGVFFDSIAYLTVILTVLLVGAP